MIGHVTGRKKGGRFMPLENNGTTTPARIRGAGRDGDQEDQLRKMLVQEAE